MGDGAAVSWFRQQTPLSYPHLSGTSNLQELSRGAVATQGILVEGLVGQNNLYVALGITLKKFIKLYICIKFSKY